MDVEGVYEPLTTERDINNKLLVIKEVINVARGGRPRGRRGPPIRRVDRVCGRLDRVWNLVSLR